MAEATPSVWSKAAAKTLFNPLRALYVFYGEDDVQKDEAIALLRTVVVSPDFADFDCETLDADTTTPEEILAAAGMAPFGSSHRLVIVRGAELFRKREKQSDAERLAEGVQRLGKSSCLVLRVAAAEDEKSRGKTLLTAKFDRAAYAVGAVVQCRALSEQGLQDWIEAECGAAGKRIEPAAAARLIQAAHGDRIALQGELEKAVCYIGDGKIITRASVDAVCSFDPEDVMFKLVEVISQRDPDRSLRLLHELLRYDNKPQSVAGKLLALLSRQFRFLWQAHELSRNRIDAAMIKTLPARIADELPSEGSITAMAWKARDLYALARLWDRESLVQAFEALLECDLANKGGQEGSTDVVTNIELLILSLCRTK